MWLRRNTGCTLGAPSCCSCNHTAWLWWTKSWLQYLFPLGNWTPVHCICPRHPHTLKTEFEKSLPKLKRMILRQNAQLSMLFCGKFLLSLIKFGCNVYYHGPSHISISGVWTFAVPIAWESPKTKLLGGGGVPSERIQWLWVRKWNLPSTKLGSTKSHHKQQVRLTMLETIQA